MNILLTGATGFIGIHIQQALTKQGYNIIRAVRQPTQPTDIQVNFLRDNHSDVWLSRLDNIDMVINTVGLIHGNSKDMNVIHCETPSALAQASQIKGIKHFVHFSALGVDSDVDTLYFASKLAGERKIRTLFPQATIIRPSLIFGLNGTSSQLFMNLTYIPLLILPQLSKNKQVQPLHIDDLTAGIVALVNQKVQENQTVQTFQRCQTIKEQNNVINVIDFVGSTALSMGDYLKTLSVQLNRRFPFKIQYISYFPSSIFKIITSFAELLPQNLLTHDTILMLCTDNKADVTPFAKLLGRSPIPLNEFVKHESL